MLYQDLEAGKRKGINKYRHGDAVLYDDRPDPEGEEQKQLRKIYESGASGVVRGSCAYCGMEFYQKKNRPGKYCSIRCRNDAYMERRRLQHEMTLQKICTVCGTLYDATRADSRYCSAACKQQAYRSRNKNK